MATEKNTFPFKGLTIEVSSGDEAEQAYIKFVENDVEKEYRIDGNKTSKANQEVVVFYNKFIKDADGNVVNQDILQSFVATEQESASYFYNIPAGKIGLKLDKMSINGLLYVLKGALCYATETGDFYPPISAEFTSTPATYSMLPAEERTPDNLSGLIPNIDGTITVNPIDIIGNPTFTILDLNVSNETGEFKDLAKGTYRVLVTSDAAEMPCLLVVTVEEGEVVTAE